ncbi:MAG TPA: chromate transporter [Myxococcota bacterium]
MSERQLVDAVAVAMITPGPVVITVAFIGYLVAGPAGAIAGAAFVLGRRAVFDGPTLAIATVTLLLITRLKSRYEPLVILGAGLVGLAWSGSAARPPTRNRRDE